MLVIASVLALIVTSVVLLTPPDNRPKIKPGRLKLQEIIGHELTPLRFNGSWISDEELMYKDENLNIVVLNAFNLTTRIILPSQTFRRFSVVKFTMSPDGKYLLLVHNTKKLFRHSFLAQYSAYDINNGQNYHISSDPKNDKEYLVHAQWSSKGHGILFVLDYDIYYRPNPKSQQVFRVTNTAVPGLVHNGVPDWLYEEEILDDNKALWMSNDGRLLLYACFNDTLVQEFQFPWYGVDKETKQLYPEIRKLRYPKPGTTNPHVTLFIADLADTKNIKIKDLKPPMALGQTTDYYFNGVSWVSATEVAVVWMNRAQNVSMVTLCKNPMWFCQETQRVTGLGSGWVEAPPPPIFSNDGNTYLTLAPVRDGSAGFFRHIVSVNIPKKRFVPITQGTFEVVKIVSWHLQNNAVYYLAIYLSQLHLYSIKTVNNSRPFCMSCPKNMEEGPKEIHKTLQSQVTSVLDDSDYDFASTEAPVKVKKKKKEEINIEEPLYRDCLYHNAVFSTNSTYYVLECLGPGIPTVWLYKTDSGCLMNLQNNTKLYEKVSKVALPQVKTFPVEISGGYQAQVRLFLPPGLREGEITKYPLLLQLVSSNQNQLNWRGILIAMLVIASVLALIVTSVVLLTPPDNRPKIKPGRLKLQEIIGHELTPLRFNGSWISDEELMYKDENLNIVVLNAFNLTTRIILPSQTFRRFSVVKFTMSPDGKYLLLVHNTKKLFRHSFLAQYSAYDINNGQNYHISSDPKNDKEYLVHAQWSSKGHGILFVLDYDIYYRPNPKSQQVFRVTNTAVPGLVHNGVPDWLYEEEILDDNKALWMSNDGRLLLYACFNDTLVQEFQFPWYGVDKETKQLYPEIRKLRYPKPGTTNPHVTLFIADLADTKNIKIKDLKPPMALGQTTDYYFNGVSWVSATEVAVVWMNRAQNVSMVTLCKNPMWFCQETQRVTGLGSGWVEAPPPPIFSNDGNTYLTLAPVRDGSAGFFRHIVSVNIPKKRFVPITQGTFEVVKIVSWHLQNNAVYYLAIYLSQLHLYSIKTVNNSRPFCMSCPKNMEEGPKEIHKTLQSQVTSVLDDSDYDFASTEAPVKVKKKKKEEINIEEPLYRDCLYHNAVFSTNSTYYVLECLGPGIPTVWLYKTDSGCLMNLQNNTKLYEKVSKVALPQVKTFPVEISGGYQAQVRLFLPPGLREGEITKYPLLLQVYGGPGSQLVTDKWKIDWGTYLASTQDIIVGYIDGRGTSGKGYTLTHQVYMRLGAVEAADQLEVTEYLRDNLHFIDKRRVGVWGWSYGGFVAGMLLSTPGQQIFQCGAAVAPITSWRLYDSAYTERYMGMPNVTGNYKGYEEAELSRKVKGLKDKSLYLVHGTADDNVHLQQALHYARALSSAGIVYSQQIYPDENHSLSGVKKHLYRSLENFFNNCFRKQVPQESKAGLRNGGAEW